jgi:hypothetical protein
MRCATHPDVDTNLRCGKCGKPICPKCLVQTPVGARCRDCARLQKLPTFHVTSSYYLRAIGAAVGMAFACGAAWWKINTLWLPIGLDFLLAAGFGYAIGEVVGRSVNRKRSRGLAITAGAGVALSFVISIFPPWGYWLVPRGGLDLALSLLAVALGVWVAVTRVR